MLIKFHKMLVDKKRKATEGEASIKNTEPTIKRLRAPTQPAKAVDLKKSDGGNKAPKTVEGGSKAPKNAKSPATVETRTTLSNSLLR